MSLFKTLIVVVFAFPPALAQIKTNVGRISYPGLARTLIAEAKKSALKIPRNFQRGLILDEIGAIQADLGDFDEAIDTANRAYPNTMVTLTAIGTQLGKSNDLSKPRAIEPRLRGGGASTVFAFLAQAQAENGRFEDALRTTEIIKAPEVRSDALEWIAEHQAQKGDYAAAQKTLTLAKAIDPTRHSNANYRDMIITQAKLGNGDSANVSAMVDAIMSPDEKSFAMLGAAESFLERGDRAEATNWLNQALQQNPPNEQREILKYFAIPIQVKLGEKGRAMDAAGSLTHADLRLEGYMAVAVTCAEQKDIACVNQAVAKMTDTGKLNDDGVSRFGLQLSILNVASALIDSSEFEAALSLIVGVEQNLERSEILKPTTQLQRVFITAQQGKFDEARFTALKIRSDSVDENHRGEALRITALLQTKADGSDPSKEWALKLTDLEDRAYALLGIAQALLDTGKVKLPYSALQVH
jgi:tetratricopeptide (TPR) repeat protein